MSPADPLSLPAGLAAPTQRMSPARTLQNNFFISTSRFGFARTCGRAEASPLWWLEASGAELFPARVLRSNSGGPQTKLDEECVRSLGTNRRVPTHSIDAAIWLWGWILKAWWLATTSPSTGLPSA